MIDFSHQNTEANFKSRERNRLSGFDVALGSAFAE